MENYSEISKKMASIARRYRSDSGYKAQVDADPAAALRSEGFGDMVPEGASVDLHLDDEKTAHVVFPPASCLKPASEEALSQISGGGRRPGVSYDYGDGYESGGNAWQVSGSYRLQWSWPSGRPRPGDRD